MPGSYDQSSRNASLSAQSLSRKRRRSSAAHKSQVRQQTQQPRPANKDHEISKFSLILVGCFLIFGLMRSGVEVLYGTGIPSFDVLLTTRAIEAGRDAFDIRKRNNGVVEYPIFGTKPHRKQSDPAVHLKEVGFLNSLKMLTDSSNFVYHPAPNQKLNFSIASKLPGYKLLFAVRQEVASIQAAIPVTRTLSVSSGPDVGKSFAEVMTDVKICTDNLLYNAASVLDTAFEFLQVQETRVTLGQRNLFLYHWSMPSREIESKMSLSKNLTNPSIANSFVDLENGPQDCSEKLQIASQYLYDHKKQCEADVKASYFMNDHLESPLPPRLDLEEQNWVRSELAVELKHNKNIASMIERLSTRLDTVQAPRLWTRLQSDNTTVIDVDHTVHSVRNFLTLGDRRLDDSLSELVPRPYIIKYRRPRFF